MTVDYGSDIAALDYLPDPEQWVSGPLLMAYAVARRWLTPAGAWDEIGYPNLVTTVDLRSYLGARLSAADLVALQRTLEAAALEDERVASVALSVSSGQGSLKVAASLVTASGSFSFVLSVDAVSASLIAQGV